MNLRNSLYWVFAFLVLTALLTLWRWDVLVQRPYGSAATGLFTQASAVAWGDVDSSATPAPTLYRSSILPAFLAGLMRIIPDSPNLLMLIYRIVQFSLASVMALALVGYLWSRAGLGGAAIVAVGILSAPVVTVQMELMGIDFPVVVLLILAGILLLRGHGFLGGLLAILACLFKWTAISYLAAGFVYSILGLILGSPRAGRGSLVVHGLGLIGMIALLASRWDSNEHLGGWVPSPAFGTSPIVDIWWWSPDLLVYLAITMIALAALGRWSDRSETTMTDPTEAPTGFSLLDPPILLGGLVILFVFIRLVITGATPAELAIVIPFLFLIMGWVAFSWPKFRPASISFFFVIAVFQLVNSTGMMLPAIPNSIDYRTSSLRERSREYLDTDHALQVEGLLSLLERGRDTTVATVPPMVHYLSLPALGYVREPFEGYSLGGPTTRRFKPIDDIRTDPPPRLSVVYLRNRYAANHEWTIPLPEAGDELIYPRAKERREQPRWKTSRLFVYKAREVPSESADETTRRLIRRIWPSAGSIDRARQLAQTGRSSEAEILYRQILQWNPSDHAARLQLGELLEGREDWAGAQQEYRRIPLGSSEYWQALSRAAGIEVVQKNYEAADRAFADAISSLRKEARSDPRELAMLYLRWGLADMVRQDWVKAEEKLAQATGSDPSFSLAFRERGLVLMNQSKWLGAKDQLELALDLDREDPRTHFYLASALVSLKDWDRARAEFMETLRLDPSNLVAQQGLSEALLKLRRYEEAAGEYEDALSRVPEREKGQRAVLLMGLSDAQRGKGDWAGAITSLRRALVLEEGTKLAANQLAWLLATAPVDEWRNGEEAVQMAEDCLADPQVSAAFLDTLAASYAEIGKWDLAMTTIDRAIQKAEADRDESLLQECQHRRDLYREQKPFRDKAEP
ncbi:tetratricopeptide repeat protein [bacterium]|nr:tetratricopeptide repeat protein [bacterium]